ncbi:competence type IV pilus minor pilin ComGF [Virgibacillus sp. 6R]|uniref:competence type IV pilus minor pilin ComGF n=1 Tax=Metabacillus sp. 22489 TaxID=3453928 RepID=UPI002106FF95
MQIIKRKKLVYYYRNEQGCTFLNMLLSFIVYAIIISSLSMVFHFLMSHSQHSHDLKPFEWELFTVQLHRELKDATDIQVKDEQLSFKNKLGEIVTVQQYKNLIRRQVNGKGHEIYLFRVKDIELNKIEDGIKIKVFSNFGKDYEHIFRIFKDLKV